MLDIIDTIRDWAGSGKEFVMARVVGTWGSAPRIPGSAMVISADSQVAGSVSGGCVEGEVIKASKEVLSSGEPKFLHFGISNDQAWSVGLTCGGKLDVYLEKFIGQQSEDGKTLWETIDGYLDQDRPFVWITNLDNGQGEHWLWSRAGEAEIEDHLKAQAGEAWKRKRSMLLEREGEQYFYHVFPSKPRLVIVGAAHISQDLVELGNRFDFYTIVIDPRGIFTKQQGGVQANADEVHTKWPAEVLENMELDNNTYAVLLTHDPKIDDQALSILLPSKVGYIGALGSSRTHEKRKKRLMDAGFTEEQLGRVEAPVGIEMQTKYPKEIALSIITQVIDYRNRPS